MKSKVVNLFGDKNKDQNENYAVLLRELIEPFKQEFPEEFSFEDIIYFGLNAWNFGNMNSILAPKDYKRILSAASPRYDEASLLTKLVKRKVAKFKEHKLFIGDFEIIESDGEPIIRVTVEDEEEFLEKLMNEGDPSQMETNFEEGYINRYAIILKPKKPFFDWINKVEPNDPQYEVDESNIYLVSDEIHDVEGWLKKNFTKFFVYELEDEILDKKNWPKNRNYKMFKQWFNVEFSTMIYDLENNPVYKED